VFLPALRVPSIYASCISSITRRPTGRPSHREKYFIQIVLMIINSILEKKCIHESSKACSSLKLRRSAKIL